MMKPILFKEQYGPWALVTGASSGIGMAFAKLLAQHGINLIITARRMDRLEKLAEELQARHAITAIPLELDLSNNNLLQQVAEVSNGKDIGLVISNAGFGLKGLHQNLPLESLNRMLDVNCRAPMQLAHYFIPRLQQRGHGGFIITSSIEGFFGFPSSAGYSASKAYAKALGEALWGETLDSNIDILVLCPGLTDTEAPALQGFNKEEMSGMMAPEAVAQQALDRLGKQPVLVSATQKYRIMMTILSHLPRCWTLALSSRVARQYKV